MKCVMVDYFDERHNHDSILHYIGQKTFKNAKMLFYCFSMSTFAFNICFKQIHEKSYSYAT